jgi:hypothetical protein
MVAKVMGGKSVQNALKYNEQKVAKGKACCLQANLFKADIDALSFADKLGRFVTLHERNRRAKTNTLHVSLNFAIGEKLDQAMLKRIASTYMERIGFADQPYLVYEHFDAAHPHLHIVSSCIRSDGSQISIFRPGRGICETAARQLEIELGLVQAACNGKPLIEGIGPAAIQKAVYGKCETKRSIEDIVRAVTQDYKYTSLAELNAVLGQFQVMAIRGSVGSKMYENGGLIYSLIDEKGKRMGVPIKASAIAGKPTLKFLEKQFKLNKILGEPHQQALLHAIDQVLKPGTVVSVEQLKNALAEFNIAVLPQAGSEGKAFEMTYIDNRTGCVFSSHDLGERYRTSAILDRLSAAQDRAKSLSPIYTLDPSDHKQPTDSSPSAMNTLARTLRDLVTADDTLAGSMEGTLKIQRKRRRKKARRL